MSACGCEEVHVVDVAPDGFRSLTRGFYHSLEGARRGAKKAIKEGQKNIVIVHNRSTAMYEESWHVGHAPVPVVMEPLCGQATAVVKETVEAVEETVEAVEESSSRIAQAPYESFVVDACQIAPFYELRRVPSEFQACFKRAHDFGKIKNSRRGYDLFIQDVAAHDQEVFYVAAIDTKVYCRGVMRVHKGVRDGTLVDPAICLQAAFAMGAKAMLAAHCHPSGEGATPSPADLRLTEDLKKACEAAKMGFFDHLVIASTGKVPQGEYYSCTDQKGYRVDANGNQTEV